MYEVNSRIINIMIYFIVMIRGAKYKPNDIYIIYILQ